MFASIGRRSALGFCVIHVHSLDSLKCGNYFLVACNCLLRMCIFLKVSSGTHRRRTSCIRETDFQPLSYPDPSFFRLFRHCRLGFDCPSIQAVNFECQQLPAPIIRIAYSRPSSFGYRPSSGGHWSSSADCFAAFEEDQPHRTKYAMDCFF